MPCWETICIVSLSATQLHLTFLSYRFKCPFFTNLHCSSITVVVAGLRPKSIFVCEATCSAVLYHPFWRARVWLKRLFQVINCQPFSSEVIFFGFSSLFSCLSMGKKRSLSEAQRAQIVILRQEGYTERAISERLAVSKTPVHQAVVKFKNCVSYSDCKRSGRPRKTTQRDYILIKRCVVKSPTCSAKNIRAELQTNQFLL